jgi:hypothetical protein
MKNRILLTLCAVCALTAFSAAPALATHDTEAKTLSVSRSGGGAVSGGGIDCGATCAVQDQPGESCEYVGNGNGTDGPNDRLVCEAVYHAITLTAHNQNGWSLSGWGGACSGAATTCTVTMNTDRTVSATFADVAAPSVSITGPDAGIRQGTFALSANASDNATITRVAFYVRGVKISEDTSAPYAASFDSTTVGDGAAELKAVAIDSSSLAGTATRNVTIDNGKPTLNFNGGPNGQTFGLGTTHTWTFAAADAGAGVASVQCKLDAAAFGACSGGSVSHSVSNLGDGSHTLTVKVTDAAGHSDTFTRSVVIDGVAPQTAITGGTADGAASTATSASFQFAADQAGSTFKCRVYPAALTPGAFGPCSGAASHAAAGFSPGTYAFEVVATDPYGNLDASPAKRTFTVKAPTTSGGGGQTPVGGGGQTTGGGGGGQTGGGAPTGGRIDAKINTFWKLYGKRTRVQTLTVGNAPLGSKVTISCKGKGCAFRKVSSTLTGPKLKLAVRFKGRKLKAQTVITIVIAKEGWIPKTFRYTTRPGRFPRLTLS